MDSREEAHWTREYEGLMAAAKSRLRPEWDHGEVVVLKTASGAIYVAEIPDYQDAEVREPLENRCLQQMVAQNDTHVAVCLATVNGEIPEILSWNFRSQLMEMNEENIDAVCFLWGGGDKILAKPFRRLLPPNYKSKERNDL